MGELEKVKFKLRDFAEDRDWDQFHSPKNLAMALGGEAGELLERFQWLTEEQSKNLNMKDLGAVSDEIADIQIYLIRLADKLGIDILQEVARKIEDNSRKYPVSKSKGNAKKYTDL